MIGQVSKTVSKKTFCATKNAEFIEKKSHKSLWLITPNQPLLTGTGLSEFKKSAV